MALWNLINFSAFFFNITWSSSFLEPRMTHSHLWEPCIRDFIIPSASPSFYLSCPKCSAYFSLEFQADKLSTIYYNLYMISTIFPKWTDTCISNNLPVPLWKVYVLRNAIFAFIFINKDVTVIMVFNSPYVNSWVLRALRKKTWHQPP